VIAIPVWERRAAGRRCDTRFALGIANNSGARRGALPPSRRNAPDITGRFPYWFCPSFARYAGREQELPFDQHQLVAACAPRRVLVGSALDDAWADPQAEFLSCVLADGVYRQLGLGGLVAPGRMPFPATSGSTSCRVSSARRRTRPQALRLGGLYGCI
jgi:hypothetical protein